MSQSRPYRLARQRNLLLVQAAVGGTDGTVLVLRLLLDTGASYTMLPVEAVEALGRDTLHPLRRIRMVAANGVIVAPLVEMSWFHCLGQRLDNFPTVATAPQYPASPKLMQNVALAAALGLMAGVFATLRFSSRQSQKTLDE